MAAPPYYSQWESPELVRAFLRGQLLPREDPSWASSGAETAEEYEWWAARICGVACLRSVLAGRGIEAPPSVVVAKRLLGAGAYRRRADGGLDGLIYAPFVEHVASEWSLDAEVAAPLTVGALASAVRRGGHVMASVSPAIRQAQGRPGPPGGHLVLVHGAGPDGVVLHNPSGDTAATQASAVVPWARFDQCFAGRAIVIR